MSVQEDWIRHIQQHILQMNYSRHAEPSAPADPPTSGQASALASTSTSSTTPALTSTLTPDPTPPAECTRITTATEITQVLEEQPTRTANPVPVPVPVPVPAPVV